MKWTAGTHVPFPFLLVHTIEYVYFVCLIVISFARLTKLKSIHHKKSSIDILITVSIYSLTDGQGQTVTSTFRLNLARQVLFYFSMSLTC
ncbi:unnamed protein product [Rotaria magnacalcarata]